MVETALANGFVDIPESLVELAETRILIDQSPGWRWLTIAEFNRLSASKLRKHFGPGDHPSGSPQSVHGGGGKKVTSASGKRTGRIVDPVPATSQTGKDLRVEGLTEQAVKDIFEGTLTLPTSDGEVTVGREFKALVLQAEPVMIPKFGVASGPIPIEGIITSEGEFVGEFERQFNPDGTTIDNIRFFISPEFQGQGIGTMFLSHWEDELAAAGITHMNVSTSEIGNYAWAIAGYEFSGLQHEVMEDAESMVRVWKSQQAVQAPTLSSLRGVDIEPMQLMAAFQNDDRSWRELETWTDEWRQVQLYPTPLTLAMIGSDRPQGDTHFGKELMLALPSWNGRKDITIKKSLGPARAIWKRWAQNNPAGIEKDDPVFLAELAAAVRIEKHLPGQHNQKTHGRRTGKVTSATGKLSGIITDPAPVTDDLLSGLNRPFDIAYDVFEATLELPDGTKVFAEVRDVSDVGGNLKVFGVFTTDAALTDSLTSQIGGFTRIFKPGDAVYNADLKISEDFQGRGIGTMFLSHWEDELAAAGVKEMTVSSVDVGRYAWAVAGYDWKGQQEFWKRKAQIVFDLHDADFSQSSSIGSMAKYQGDAKSWSTLGTLLKKWDDAALFTRRPDSQVPTPLDFALIGSDRPVGDSHFGKDLFLQGPPWSGKKKLLAKSLAEARAIWKRWAQSNPAAIEADDPEFLAEMSSAVKVEKHLPGKHDQKSHGNWARGKADNLVRIMRQFADFMSGRKAEGVLTGNTGLGVSASLEAIVLEHGRAYTAPTNESNQALMDEFDVFQGELKDCYMNCAQAVVFDDVDLTYVEGYALPSSVPMPVHHAWMVTSDGRVVDNTWGQDGIDPGIEYFGIPFDKTWLSQRMLETEVWGVFQGRKVADIEDAIAN